MAEDFLQKFALTGKVAWVTGASYGLGLAYAKAFAAVGAKIVFNDINQDLVDRGMKAYEEAGIKAYGKVCDVTNEEQVQAFVKDVEEHVHEGCLEITCCKRGMRNVGELFSIVVPICLQKYSFFLNYARKSDKSS